jgi:hypothetical protein
VVSAPVFGILLCFDTRSGEHLLVGVFVSVEALKENVNEAGTEVTCSCRWRLFF